MRKTLRPGAWDEPFAASLPAIRSGTCEVALRKGIVAPKHASHPFSDTSHRSGVVVYNHMKLQMIKNKVATTSGPKDEEKVGLLKDSER